mgnify:CR=1 FL=1
MKYSILGEEKICQIYKDTEKALDKTVGHIVQLLDREKQTVATAESCTGGLLSQLITSVSGASRVFELGICTYAERMKTKFLGVPAELIAGKGVVSAEVAMAMAHGLRQQSDAALCLSVTGIAGPGRRNTGAAGGHRVCGDAAGGEGSGCALTALAVRLV